jgi:hypothetical protein
LPFDATRSGALKGMAARVDGRCTTHSLRDYAVGVSYPAASMSNGEDAAAFDNPSGRWGAMGTMARKAFRDKAAARRSASPIPSPRVRG